jgi:hypothetical protein
VLLTAFKIAMGKGIKSAENGLTRCS